MRVHTRAEEGADGTGLRHGVFSYGVVGIRADTSGVDIQGAVGDGVSPVIYHGGEYAEADRDENNEPAYGGYGCDEEIVRERGRDKGEGCEGSCLGNDTTRRKAEEERKKCLCSFAFIQKNQKIKARV